MYWLPARLYKAWTFTKRDSIHLTGARVRFFLYCLNVWERLFHSTWDLSRAWQHRKILPLNTVGRGCACLRRTFRGRLVWQNSSAFLAEHAKQKFSDIASIIAFATLSVIHSAGISHLLGSVHIKGLRDVESLVSVPRAFTHFFFPNRLLSSSYQKHRF